MDKGLETSKISSSGDPTGRTLHPATGQTVAKVLVTDLCTESQSNDISEVQALIEENKVLKAQFRELKKDSEKGMGTRRNLAEENDCVQFREKEEEEEEKLHEGEGNGMATRSTVSETASETSTCINSAAQKGTGTRKNLAEENDCVQFREKEKEEEQDKLLKGEECGTIDSATQKEIRTRKNSPEEHDCVQWKQNLKGETVHKKDVEASRMRIPSEEAMSDCRTEDEVRNRKKEFKRVNPDIRTAEGNEVHGQKLGNRSSKVQYSDLKLDMIVGKGAFGEVWKGNLGCIEVAVKKPRKISSDVQKLFEQEFKIISQLEHPNVVTFIAVVVDVDGPPWIVLEYGNCGSLQKLLKERLLRPFEVFSFAHDAGCGLSYLHSRLPVPILHRDIHPGNLLLFKFNTPPGKKLKLCDFGNGRSWGSIMTPDLGAPHLNAPETITHQYTTKAEVYRFGWVLFNMLRKSEWPDCEELKRQVQEELPQLINWCREQDADLRPNMQAVVKELKKMKEHYITFRGQVERNPVEKYVITETSFNGH